MRKAWHRAEREWLRCGDKETKRKKRRLYVEKRECIYKKAVSRAKKRFEEGRLNLA